MNENRSLMQIVADIETAYQCYEDSLEEEDFDVDLSVEDYMKIWSAFTKIVAIINSPHMYAEDMVQKIKSILNEEGTH